MTKFDNNNAKYINTSYIIFKTNFKYQHYIFYKKDFKFCFKSKIVDKLLNKFKNLIILY